jgi:putative phosphoesterase
MAKIGIISDTHDDMAAIRKAVDLLNEKGVTHIIHAGDIVSPFTFEVLRDLRCPFIGIFGNNDGDRVLLREKSGDSIEGQPRVVELHGKRIAVVHEPDIAESLARSGDFDVVVYGHSHTPDVRRIKGALVINPGKAARLHKGTSTLAVLDMDSLEAEVIGL